MALFDSIADVYDDTRSLPPEIMSQVTEKLVELLEPGTTVLDVGVGTGRFSIPMCNGGIEVTGIDLSTGMLAKCQEKGFGNIIRSNACVMPFRDKQFDNAFMTHVLHLVDDRHSLLSEICRVTVANLVSVLAIWPRDNWPGKFYSERVKELGHEQSERMMEKDLAETIPPWDRVLVARYSRDRDNDAFIQLLKERKYSSTAGVPEDMHQQAISDVLAKYGGKSEIVGSKVEIVFWDIEALSEFLLNTE